MSGPSTALRPVSRRVGLEARAGGCWHCASSISPPAQQRATLTTGANIRSGPSVSASIVRVGKKGDALIVFDAREGWLQVGGDKPEGWVAANLVNR